MATQKIRQSQIEPGPEISDFKATLEIVKNLSAAGYVWRPADRAWARESDGAAFSEEVVEDFARFWPPLVPFACRAIARGARGFTVSITDLGNTVTATLMIDSLLESLAKATQ